MSEPWPHPADTALDRARAIGGSLLAALRKHAPEAAATYERAAHELGETWLGATSDLEPPDGLVSADELGRRMGVSASLVRDWASRGVGPGASSGQGRKLTRYPGGFDPVEAAQLVAWARHQRG